MSRWSAIPRVLISSTQEAVRVPRKKLNELIPFVVRKEKAAVAEVDLAVVGARRIAAMNRRYLRHAGATDVLSFDLSESSEKGIHAQIVVCGDIAAREGRKRGHGPQRELMLYVVHGLLHVIGHDDTTPRTAARMHAREEEILAEFLRCR